MKILVDFFMPKLKSVGSKRKGICVRILMEKGFIKITYVVLLRILSLNLHLPLQIMPVLLFS